MTVQKKKYLMFISYLGSGFRGSQIQFPKENDGKTPVKTVQKVFEGVLRDVFQDIKILESERPLPTVLSSRTDTGVHALKTAVTVFLPKYRKEFLKPEFLVEKLNFHLAKSENVRVLEAYIVPDSFKFSEFIRDKTYLYRVGLLKEEFHKRHYNNIVPIAEIDRTFFTGIRPRFDFKRAQEATHLFEGIKDFGAIVGRPSQNKRPTICNILSFSIQDSQPLFPLDPLCERYSFYEFLCKGNRFLYHMVRRMVSLTLGVGFNLFNVEDIQKLFDKPVPSSWPKKGNLLVPGYGLYLLDTRIDLEKIQKEEISERTKSEVHSEMNFSEKLIKASS